MSLYRINQKITNKSLEKHKPSDWCLILVQTHKYINGNALLKVLRQQLTTQTTLESRQSSFVCVKTLKTRAFISKKRPICWGERKDECFLLFYLTSVPNEWLRITIHSIIAPPPSSPPSKKHRTQRDYQADMSGYFGSVFALIGSRTQCSQRSRPLRRQQTPLTGSQ